MKSKITLIRLTSLLILIGMMIPTLSYAHRCRFQKADDRNLCLAKKENARYFCSYIQNKDQKKYCYAYLDLAPDQCSGIEEETVRTQCEAEVKVRFEADQKRKELEAKQKAKRDALEAKRKEAQQRAKKKK